MKSPLNIKEAAYEKQNKKMRSEYTSETGKKLGKRLTSGKNKRRVSFACRFADGAPGLMLIKTGVLDEQPNIDPTMVCWTDSKPNWLEIKHPDIKFEKNPG